MNGNTFRPYLVLLGTTLLGMAVIASLAQPPGTSHAKQTSITYKPLDPFAVIGIAARTSNAREEGAEGIIPKQWEKFFEASVGEKIPHRIGSDIYAIYTDYASDHNGEYTYLIGAKVEQGTAPPAGMLAVVVPAGSYAIVTSKRGPLRHVVPAAWQEVFQLENAGKLHRAYNTDFEVYDERSKNPEDAQVDLYLGVN